MSALEMFQLVDREGRPVGQASRQECHGNPRLLHLVVHRLPALVMTGLSMMRRSKI